MQNNTITIHTDGGSRGNPGPAASAFVVEKDGIIIGEGSKYLGTTTNNVAEYSAVIIALEWLLSSPVIKSELLIVNFLLDSELVVRQINGIYKVKDENLKSLFDKTIGLIKLFNIKVNFIHVRREENKRADFLVNKELDSQK
jgi:ribonuclease HI